MNQKIKELLPYIIIVVVIVVIRTFFFTPIRVNGDSMNPTLIDGEIMILNKIDKIERFEIVVIKHQNEFLIKRIVGFPKEKIVYIEGKLYINDKEVKDPYKNDFEIGHFSIELNEDEYFVLGDNRDNSLDSRYIGPINKKNIVGTTKIVMYPFDRFGIVK